MSKDRLDHKSFIYLDPLKPSSSQQAGKQSKPSGHQAIKQVLSFG